MSDIERLQEPKILFCQTHESSIVFAKDAHGHAKCLHKYDIEADTFRKGGVCIPVPATVSWENQ